MSSISLTAIVLTYNEEMHLERCLTSLKDICENIVVVDSYSTDKTKEIVKRFGANFFQNKWVNYANQFNWAINNTDIKTDWIIRVDADEYVTDQLRVNIKENLPKLENTVTGIRVKRLMYFFDKPLKKAGMYPIWHLKLWRSGKAFCEQRWMDERMNLKEGKIIELEGDVVDHNLNNLTWWTAKHNGYATREAIDILDKLYNFTNSDAVQANFFGTSEERRRWFKNKYLNLPLFVRPLLFWFIRYVLQGGILEGKRGFIWNILQCFWYRFLVDTKILEAYKKAGKNKEKLISYFKEEYGYDVTKIG